MSNEESNIRHFGITPRAVLQDLQADLADSRISGVFAVVVQPDGTALTYLSGKLSELAVAALAINSEAQQHFLGNKLNH